MVPVLCKRKFGHPQMDTLWNSAVRLYLEIRSASPLVFFCLQRIFCRDTVTLLLTNVNRCYILSNFPFLSWPLYRNHLQTNFEGSRFIFYFSPSLVPLLSHGILMLV
jgi:hypothetical protein